MVERGGGGGLKVSWLATGVAWEPTNADAASFRLKFLLETPPDDDLGQTGSARPQGR